MCNTIIADEKTTVNQNDQETAVSPLPQPAAQPKRAGIKADKDKRPLRELREMSLAEFNDFLFG